MNEVWMARKLPPIISGLGNGHETALLASQENHPAS